MDHSSVPRTRSGLADGRPDFDPPFDVVEPVGFRSNVVLSSPHSGHLYTARFLQSARLDAASLRRSEDVFVDELFMGGVAHGALAMTTAGDSSMATLGEVERLMSGGSAGTVR